ncbi:MAG: hypothetical protein J0J06_14430 [Sphingomonas sp.]|uniref:hypothetical protein n=1 Tax=Sphingomonas sp. TaxID=28214 RepID=UPI001AC08ED9|nr:hypothetical protein [Sphingomonas sp.]MBN8816630.1 hypothetical protein [Sphingomonas sp.]
MRFLLGLIAIILVVAIIAISTGWFPISGSPGSLSVNATAPTIKVDTPTVSVGTENKTIEVPKVTINKPGEPAPANTAAAR